MQTDHVFFKIVNNRICFFTLDIKGVRSYILNITKYDLKVKNKIYGSKEPRKVKVQGAKE